ncbi:MAG TPA: hypothetical protein VFW63_09825 [Acidimicrobiales bacterium]|nr:hypothetical protein [Acidimicrobiales bacterium]
MGPPVRLPVAGADPVPGRAAPGERRWSAAWLVAATAAVTLPILWLGYGTDLDIGAVLDTGARIRSFDYAPSRNPGVPVVEAVVAVLDPLGGHVLVNLATAAALAATVVAVARLVTGWGHPHGDLVALCFLASPIVLISGTQTADFVWATAFLAWAAVALQAHHPLAAGVLLALTVGSRSSSALLVVALLVAVGWDRDERRGAVTAAVVAAPLTAALYLPAWLAFDRTLGFLDTTDGWVGPANNLSRFLLKNYAVAGPALLALVAVASPALVRSLRAWNRDPLVRFAVLSLVLTEALFLRMPWKPAHLVPSLLALVLWVAASERNRRPFLRLLVGAMVLNGLVVLRPFVAESPDATEGGDLEPAVTAGWLVNDIRCRTRYMDEPPRLDSGAWACALEPMRGPARGATGELG